MLMDFSLFLMDFNKINASLEFDRFFNPVDFFYLMYFFEDSVDFLLFFLRIIVHIKKVTCTACQKL